jgi:hypothetical protein
LSPTFFIHYLSPTTRPHSLQTMSPSL